jgi:formamidopyrimidine-DNA glycosylase
LVRATPELPEITVIGRQMDKELKGKRIASIDVKQPKNLNMPVQKFVKICVGKTVEGVSSRGKWLFMQLGSTHTLLTNLGMGAELLYFKPDQKLPQKHQFRLTFSDKTGLTIHFWWFGYVHLVPEKDLSKHKMTSVLGVSPVDKEFTLEHFKKLLGGKKTAIKSFVLDQKKMAGIGNVYAQDILFKARLHPSRKASTLSETEVKTLHEAIREVLNHSIKLGGLAYEMDFYGKKGRFGADKFLVGYRAGKPCPECGTTIEKIRTGSTATYICPKCQPLK